MMPIKSKEDRAAYDRAYRAKNAERKAAYAAQAEGFIRAVMG